MTRVPSLPQVIRLFDFFLLSAISPCLRSVCRWSEYDALPD